MNANLIKQGKEEPDNWLEKRWRILLSYRIPMKIE